MKPPGQDSQQNDGTRTLCRYAAACCNSRVAFPFLSEAHLTSIFRDSISANSNVQVGSMSKNPPLLPPTTPPPPTTHPSLFVHYIRDCFRRNCVCSAMPSAVSKQKAQHSSRCRHHAAPVFISGAVSGESPTVFAVLCLQPYLSPP